MKLAQKKGRCRSHGEVMQCEKKGCIKQAHGVTTRCKKHGGGLRCVVEGCKVAALSGGTSKGEGPRCQKHGGGKRCIHDGCNRVAYGRGYCHVHNKEATAMV